MLIAQEKRKNNIAEYLIYMFQIEDQIRAYKFDISAIEKNIVNHYKVDDKTKKNISNWYENLISLMKNEKIAKSGHLQILRSLMMDLNNLHFKLLSITKDAKYQGLYSIAAPHIHLYREKSGNTVINDIETCITGLYALLLMRLKKQDISAETTKAMESFSNLLAYLSYKFKEEENPKHSD